MNSQVWQEQEERQQLMARYEEVMKIVEFCSYMWLKDEWIVVSQTLGFKFVVVYSYL